MKIVDDIDYPDEASSPNQHSMSNTKNLWVRRCIENGQIEIWYDGVFQVSWDYPDNIEDLLSAMLRYAVTIGEAKAKADLRKFLGVRP